MENVEPPAPEEPPRRHHDLDALRAAAMLLGILLHGLLSFMDLPVWPVQDVHQNSAVYEFLFHAIHGFRLPLFFLLSGFFTALLWRRRGLRALVKHRWSRVGKPFLISVFTILPLTFSIVIFFSTNVWSAAVKGHLDYLQSYLDAGGDIEKRLNFEGIPGHGGTPLHFAAVGGQREAARLLIGRGADVDAESDEREDAASGKGTANTPMIWASGAGQGTMVQLLLGAGAAVNRQNTLGQTALDAAGKREEVAAILRAAGGLTGAEMIAAGRAEPPGPAEDRAAPPIPGDAFVDLVFALPGWAQALLLASLFPLFSHLWFLYFLLWLVAGFVLWIKLARRYRWRALPAAAIASPRRWLWLLPLTLLPQLVMVQGFGPDTGAGVIPWPPSLLYYAIFFGFGAACYGRPEFEAGLCPRWRLHLLLGLLVLPLGVHLLDLRDESRNFLLQLPLSLCAVAYAWLMTFGFIGLFQSAFPAVNTRVRYLSDASYWLYLAHLPLIQVIQIGVAQWPLPSLVKCGLVCAVTVALLLLVYEHAVRYTWLGTLLNGKRERPAAA